MERRWILPDTQDPDAKPFWEGTARGELRVQRCAACGRMRIPPRPMCPDCRSLSNEWVALSGKGWVWSFVVAHPPLLPAYAELAPYNVIAVPLDEDPTLRMVGNLLATPEGTIDEVDAATIEIGAPVRVVFQQVEDVTLPRWVLRT